MNTVINELKGTLYTNGDYTAGECTLAEYNSMNNEVKMRLMNKHDIPYLFIPNNIDEQIKKLLFEREVSCDFIYDSYQNMRVKHPQRMSDSVYFGILMFSYFQVDDEIFYYFLQTAKEKWDDVGFSEVNHYDYKCKDETCEITMHLINNYGFKYIGFHPFGRKEVEEYVDNLLNKTQGNKLVEKVIKRKIDEFHKNEFIGKELSECITQGENERLNKLPELKNKGIKRNNGHPNDECYNCPYKSQAFYTREENYRKCFGCFL